MKLSTFFTEEFGALGVFCGEVGFEAFALFRDLSVLGFRGFRGGRVWSPRRFSETEELGALGFRV